MAADEGHLSLPKAQVYHLHHSGSDSPTIPSTTLTLCITSQPDYIFL